MAQCSSLQLEIRTVVLVGRQDFGRCPLAARRPTALWPLADRPVLARLLDHLAGEGISRIVVCCDQDAARSVETICAQAGADVEVLTENLTKGTAGCLRDAVASHPGDVLVAMSGSIVAPPSMRTLIEAHRADGADLTVVFNPSESEDGSPGAPAEIYLCNPAVLRNIPLHGYSDIKEGLIPSILRAGGRVRPLVLPQGAGNYHDRQGYLDAVALHLANGGRAGEGADGRGCAASIHPTARIYGSVSIGEQVQVEQDAVIVGPAVVGAHAVIGAGSTVVHSVLWERAQLGARCEVRESVVAEDTLVPDEAEVVQQAVSGSGRMVKSGSSRRPAARDDSRIAGVMPKKPVYVAGGIAILLALMWSYSSVMAGLWDIWRASDEYSAGMLVPLLAVYIVWSRRSDFAGVAVKPALAGGIVLFVLAQALRTFGLHRMYASAERLSLIVSVTAIVLLLLGWQWLRKLGPVLVFLFLMLPLPNRVQQGLGLPLQGMATDSAVFCLELVGANVQQDGNIINIDGTPVEVAKACNGLSMITAFIIISGLVVLLARRAWWEKLIVVISSLPIALACNTLRLTVTALLFSVIEGAWLKDACHDFGGYAMMPFALALMVGELWLLARLTTPPVETTPDVIARQKPQQVPGS